MKRRQEAVARKADEEGKLGKDSTGEPSKKRAKGHAKDRNPALDDKIDVKLEMGLSILKNLAHEVHKGVLNTNTLQTEHGCNGFAENLLLDNTSLLLSVPHKLEPYPGRTGARSWMGQHAVRFHQDQRGKVPAAGAAPAAELAGEAVDEAVPAELSAEAAPQDAQAVCSPRRSGTSSRMPGKVKI